MTGEQFEQLKKWHSEDEQNRTIKIELGGNDYVYAAVWVDGVLYGGAVKRFDDITKELFDQRTERRRQEYEELKRLFEGEKVAPGESDPRD